MINGEVKTSGEITGSVNNSGTTIQEYTLPIASADTLGGIKIGANLNIDEDGTLNATASGTGTGNVSSDIVNSIAVVDELPETEVEGVLYLVKEEVNNGNLYDYESAPMLINAKVEDGTIVTGTNDNRITYIEIEPNTTYKIGKTINDHFGVGLSTEEPVIGTVFNSYSNDETLSEVTVTSGESDNYLAIYYWTKYDTGTEEEIRKSIVVTKVLI